MQIIYNRSYCEVKEPRIIEGRYTKDFGKEFYCTILSKQAEKWAKNMRHHIYECYIENKINISPF